MSESESDLIKRMWYVERFELNFWDLDILIFFGGIWFYFIFN